MGNWPGRQDVTGHPVEEACRELKDFDPVLARLMPLLGNNRLLKVLELYTGFLVNLERVRESLKTALLSGRSCYSAAGTADAP